MSGLALRYADTGNWVKIVASGGVRKRVQQCSSWRWMASSAGVQQQACIVLERLPVTVSLSIVIV